MIVIDLFWGLFMKKNKENHHPASQPAASSEAKNSSALITLQLLNKEKEKAKEAENKEAAAEAAKIRCRTCFKEIAPKRICSGHGGGGGGGDSATSDKASEENASSGEGSIIKPGNEVETMDELFGEFDSVELDLETSFDPQIIAELIAKELVLVDSDRESMTLIIKLLCEPNTLTEEQRDEFKKFMEAIITEFNEFKAENNLSDDCMQLIQDEKGHISSLRITMPTLALYDSFIQRLANNLVPIPSPKAQKEDDVTKEQALASNPFSMQPKPSLSKHEKIEEDEEKKELFNPSPFNMKPW